MVINNLAEYAAILICLKAVAHAESFNKRDWILLRKELLRKTGESAPVRGKPRRLNIEEAKGTCYTERNSHINNSFLTYKQQ